ncbi:MAG: threonine-phosphate decarboxylase [Candidatus Omnitrophica bacterium]|nr:threonine-phosphate decarboxylase [Candidatus Omnitrophota bacterium]
MSQNLHGGDLKSFARKFRLSEENILDFSSNINPLGIPEFARRLYPDLAEDLSRYPDPRAEDLRQEIARHYPVFPENVIAGNGSMAILSLAIQTLAPKRAILIEPCFYEYREILNREGAEVRSVLLREREGFEFPLPEITGALRGADLMVIGHPNNPTGTAVKRDQLLELISEARRQNIFVIVDEAFSDWSPEISLAKEIRDNSSFLVVKSLTKFYALAGIRSGFGLGTRRLIEKMQSAQEIWSCNRLAQKLSIAALQDNQFRQETLDWFGKESAFLREQINLLGEFRAYPSLANFFLVKTLPAIDKKTNSATPFFEFLGQRGIYVRQAAGFAGLDHAYFRTAIRLRHENEKLIQALKAWMKIRHSEPRRGEESREILRSFGPQDDGGYFS